jgi:MFS family permease
MIPLAAAPAAVGAGRAILPALALAQFLASYANTSLNVSISSLSQDLGTTVTAVQTAITLFTLAMATLIPPICILVTVTIGDIRARRGLWPRRSAWLGSSALGPRCHEG